MLPVSLAFTQAAEATVRQIKPLVEIVWSSPFIDTAVDESVNDNNRISFPAQTHDGTRNIIQKWAHLDGIFKPDGTYHPAPADPGVDPLNQMGWYGATECDGSAEWVTNPELEVTFDPRPIVELLVIGDAVYGEFPTDFEIEVYEGVALAHTEVVTGNNAVTWSLDVTSENLLDVTRMVLIVQKWNIPNRIVKISEFYSLFKETYNGDQVSSINLLEERVIEEGSLPVGSISSNEIDLTMNNIRITVGDDEIIDPFFPDNPNSPYHNVVTKNRKVSPSLGFVLPNGSVEYVKLGTFWTMDWQVNEQSGVANVTCRDRMEFLRKAEYKGSHLLIDSNLYELVLVVLNSAKTDIPMPGLNWEVDIALQDFTLAHAWFGKITYFEAIRQIAEACMGQAYMNRDDILIIEGPEQTYRP